MRGDVKRLDGWWMWRSYWQYQKSGKFSREISPEARSVLFLGSEQSSGIRTSRVIHLLNDAVSSCCDVNLEKCYLHSPRVRARHS